MAGDYYSGMEEKKRGIAREKMRGGATKGGDYASGMEEKKSKPKPKMTSQKQIDRLLDGEMQRRKYARLADSMREGVLKNVSDSVEGKGTFSSAVEGEAQAASREAAKRQAARKAASTVGKGFLRGAARFAGPAGLAYGAYEAGDALKDTKPALALRGKIVDSLSKADDYKREKAELDALAAARKRGLATRKASDVSEVTVTAKKKSAPAMDQISMGTSPTPRAAKPTPGRPVPQATRTVSMPSTKPKVDRMKSFMDDVAANTSSGKENAVLKRLREKGFNFAKGGKINGAARKGKTKGRFI